MSGARFRRTAEIRDPHEEIIDAVECGCPSEASPKSKRLATMKDTNRHKLPAMGSTEHISTFSLKLASQMITEPTGSVPSSEGDGSQASCCKWRMSSRDRLV